MGSRPDLSRAARACLALVTLGSPALGQADVTGADRPSPSAAPAQNPVSVPFRRILYMNGGPAREPRLFESIRVLGFDAVSLHDSDDAAIAIDHGLSFYRDQVVGKGVLELRNGQWAPLRPAYLANRDGSKLIRPACLSEADQRARLHSIAATEQARLVETPPFAVCLADEASSTRRSEPLDVCAGPACLAGFRRFLQRRYGSEIDGLNLAWRSDYRAWDEVRPWTADRIRERELHPRLLPDCLTPWSDHLEFRDGLFAALISDLARDSHERFGWPAGLTGMQAPSAYGSYDFAKLMPEQRFFETYDIGGARELARSLARPGALEVATLLPPTPDQRAAGDYVLAQLGDMLTHGMAGIVVWSCGRVFDGETAEPSAFGSMVERAFDETRPVADRLAGARIDYAPIWILESQASVRAHWMLDSIPDGSTWPNRLTSHENKNSSSQAARESWLRLIQDLGFQPRFVAAATLERAGSELLGPSAPRVLVLPASLALSDRTVAVIRRFAEEGGHVVADYAPARYDERLARRSEPALDEMFGIRRADGPTAPPLVRQGRVTGAFRNANSVAIAEHGVRGQDVFEAWSDLGHVHCETTVGRGHASYLNLAVSDYARARLDPAELPLCRELRLRLSRVFGAADVGLPVWVRGKGRPPFVEVVPLRSRAGARLLAIRLNVLQDRELFADLVERGPQRLTLAFSVPTRLVDAWTGRELGEGREFEVELDPTKPLVLEQKEVRK